MPTKQTHSVEDFLTSEYTTFSEFSKRSQQRLEFAILSLESTFGEIYGTHNPKLDDTAIPARDNNGVVSDQNFVRSNIHNYLSNMYTFSETINRVTRDELDVTRTTNLSLKNSKNTLSKSVLEHSQFLIGLRHLLQHGYSDLLKVTYDKNHKIKETDKDEEVDEDERVTVDVYRVHMNFNKFCSCENWDDPNNPDSGEFTKYVKGDKTTNEISIPQQIRDFHKTTRCLTQELYNNRV